MIKFLAFILFLLCSAVADAKEVDMVVTTTAYQYDFDDGITATGNDCIPYYTVAVDPDVIPLGSEIYVYHTGQWYIADDTGSDVNGYHIDIAMEDEDECWEYGSQVHRVKVIFPEDEEE